MEDRPFIGMGNNPDGPDLPVGFSMRLGQEPEAIAGYGRLSKNEQASVIGYIRDCPENEDARDRIDRAVRCLKDGDFRAIFEQSGDGR